jgi:CMP-N,N'-diacetyllegionaminic acid synthase
MFRNRNLHAIILARGGSKGIKNKNLILVNKKTLLYWTIKRCLSSKHIKKTWVSSNSHKILKEAFKLGSEIIYRPKKLSGDMATSEEGYLHAINFIKAKHKVDDIIALQNTSPMREKNDLDKAYTKFIKMNYDSLFSASNNHESYFTWIYQKKLKPNYNIRKRPLRQKMSKFFIENGSFWIFKRKKFERVKNRLFGKIGFYQQSFFCKFQLDDYNDLELIKALSNSKIILKTYFK